MMSKKRKISALIVTPTPRTIQIGENCTKYSRFTHVNNTVVKQGAQTNALNGVDILVATPGRLLDLMNTFL